MTVMAAHEPTRAEHEPQPQSDPEHEPERTENDLLEDSFLALETPEGYRAELIEREIVVTPPPAGDHEDHFSNIVRQVMRGSATDMDISGHKGLLLRTDDGQANNYLIPDLTFAPHELRLFRGAPSWMEPDGVAMVGEITSSRPERDRQIKRRCYARAGIPFYLLVDRDAGTVTLYSEPSVDDYKEIFAVSFGKSLPLPEPFGFELETSDFL